jgi:peroxiredoxin family protein
VELRDVCVESDVKMIACEMTRDLFEFDKNDFIPQAQFGGAAMFLGFAGGADVSLFI